MKKMRMLREHFSLVVGADVVVGPCVVEVSESEELANIHKFEPETDELKDQLAELEGENAEATKAINEKAKEIVAIKEGISKKKREAGQKGQPDDSPKK